MKIVKSFPHRVREIENVWIPLTDGCRLAARIWLPEGAPRRPVPAILEYIPYRKRDGTRERDEPMHRYFAGHGYAAVRVDLRGCGESDGLLQDEYMKREQDDGREVIRWIAAQSWCDGSVGMMGKSWGGFNSLQVAALRPPELKAIITVCSTDDRYADDAHFMGGCLLIENIAWGSMLLTVNAQPPDPELVGARWREMWLSRMENSPLFAEIWLRHQRRDDYWKQGSICEDYERIRCPVYAVGGWADAYSNAVPRLLAGLRVPRKGLVGPWAHVYPHQGVPEPAIGFLQEAIRWWDRWLKGIDNGIMEEPMYRAWMQESVTPPPTSYGKRPGRWVAESTWPSPRIQMRRFTLVSDAGAASGRLSHQSESQERALSTSSPQTVGRTAGSWCGFGMEGDLPRDQREDDEQSLTFDSEPLAERLEILGAPEVTLDLMLDRDRGFLAVRLNDVAPDGSSTRVTYGLLNLTHRHSHEHPEPLQPGKRYTFRVRLNDAAHAFAPGHRIRIAMSTAYWHVAWPAPTPVVLSLFTGASFLELPTRAPSAADEVLRPLDSPEMAPPLDATDLHAFGVKRSVTRDRETRELVYSLSIDQNQTGGPALARIESIDLVTGHAIEEVFRIRETDPLSAVAEIRHQTVTRRGDWSVGVETRTRFNSTPDTFRLVVDLEARQGEKRVFVRHWKTSIPRDFL